MYKKALMESMKTNESYQIDNSFDVFYVYIMYNDLHHSIKFIGIIIGLNSDLIY
jgi:hypothetical protein